MKVYEIGGGRGSSGWLGEATSDMEKADVVVLTGGQDINPELYNEPKGLRTHFTQSRDDFEVREYKKALSLGKVIFGICRGAQLLCAMSGGKLVQDLSHPSHHDILFFDGTRISTTSCHHQLQFPWTMSKDDYRILAYAEGLSQIHLNGRNSRMMLPTDKNGITIEPELVYYKKTKSLGIQGHPEWMSHTTTLVRTLKKLTELLVEDKLEIALALGFPLERIMSDDFMIAEDEYIIYTNMVGSKKKESETVEIIN